MHTSLHAGVPNAGPGNGVAVWVDPVGLAGARNLPWRRIAKFGIGAALLGVGALTTYQQVVVRVSREAVINARVASVRAPGRDRQDGDDDPGPHSAGGRLDRHHRRPDGRRRPRLPT